MFSTNLSVVASLTLQNQFVVTLVNKKKTPDSVADVWKNVLANMSDFKELVPEFYDPTNNGDFLVNNYAIDFGFRHDGTKVADVLLPPWAEGKIFFCNQNIFFFK